MNNILTILITLLTGLTLRLILKRFYSSSSSFLSYHLPHQIIPGSLVVITGGGSGIGLEFARLFSKAHCHIILIGRNKEALNKAKSSCLLLGALTIKIIIADLSTIEGTNKVGNILYEYTTTTTTRTETDDGNEKKGEFKYLILNAGIGAILPFSNDINFYKTCEKVMEINYFSNIRLLQYLLPLLEKTHIKTNPSHIIVISSLAGILPSIYRSAYTASKHAIQGFMNALRGETDVFITLCCPGYVDTEFHKRAQLTDDINSNNQRRGMSPYICAQKCLEGALRGDSEVIMTLNGKLGYIFRPIFTKLIDAQAKKISIRSLQK